MSVANVLTSTDSGFESGLGDWLPGGVTQIAASSTQAHTGTQSMKLTCLSNGPSTAVLSVLQPVFPGVIINPSAYFYSGNNGGQTVGNFKLVWYANDKATIVGTTSPVQGTPLTTNTWTQATLVGTPAPANAFWVQLQVVVGNNTTVNTTFVDDVALGWGNYATNMCANPSFEIDLTGWSGTRGDETLTQIDTINFTGQPFITNLSTGAVLAFTHTLFGNCCLQVNTPGTQLQEGVYGPATWMPATTTGSMSCNIFGQSGTLAVSAVNQNTGAILSTQVVTLNGSTWTNVTLTGLTFIAGTNYYIQIVTYGPAQDLSFVVDGVMYQPEAPTQYVDGGQFQCYWTGTSEESASYQPYQFGIVATCMFTISGTANVINTAQVFPITNTPVLEFFITFGPPPPQGVTLTVVSPQAAMSDFGIWQGGALGNDLDPAMAYSTWNTQDIANGVLGYTRPYMTVAPSLDLINSTGGYTWKRTAYLALGWQWATTANGTTQILTDVQTELLPINAFNALTPRNYQPARQLQTIVKPDRLNYLTNPSFESGTTNWSQVGSGQTLAISNNVPVIPELPFPVGAQSLATTVTTSSGAGVQITINYLIPGRTYMASAWVQPDGNVMGDLTGSCGTGSGTMTGSLAIGFGNGQYGGGPYGGITLPTVPLPPAWQQIFFSFQATSDTHVLSFAPVNIVAAVFPYTWYLDSVLVEDGDILNQYFDGNFGVDALWLDGGTQNLCQSFYYNQLEFARHIIVDSLANNTPLGITYATPLYATMPTQ
jgi:hypothetical protein